MMAEETTLAKMEKVIAQRDEAGRWLGETNKALEALAAGTSANIDNMVVRLLPEGKVCIAFIETGQEFILTKQRFLGLIGWGRRHVGDGPKNGRPEA